MLRPIPSSTRAAAITPAEPVGARVARFPTAQPSPYSGRVGFRITRFEACAAFTSLRPAWSLNRPGRPLSSECFSRCRYLHRPLRLLPAGATVAGRDSHPLRNGALSRRTGTPRYRTQHPVLPLGRRSQGPRPAGPVLARSRDDDRGWPVLADLDGRRTESRGDRPRATTDHPVRDRGRAPARDLERPIVWFIPTAIERAPPLKSGVLHRAVPTGTRLGVNPSPIPVLEILELGRRGSQS